MGPIVYVTGEDGRRRSSLLFGVAYGTDLDAAERLLKDAAIAVPAVHAQPAPSAWAKDLGETTIDLELRFWHDYAARHNVRSSVAHHALDSLEAGGIEMPFPTQQLIISKEAEDGQAEPPVQDSG